MTEHPMTSGTLAAQAMAWSATTPVRARTPHGSYTFTISGIEDVNGEPVLVLQPDEAPPQVRPAETAKVLRPTLVYLRDQHPGESIDRVPSDLHWEAGHAIRELPNSSRQLEQVSHYNGAWYAEPTERRSQP